MKPEKTVLPVICGPTASGKTGVAVELCLRLNGEVISADSMQIYRGMEILSAAPDEDARKGIPHHLIGFLDPDQAFSASDYRSAARARIDEVVSRGKQPVLCGGTGLYIDAVTRLISFFEGADPALREELRAIANDEGGKERLHRMLMELDPGSADRLDPADVRRVIRAIEICKTSGKTLTERRTEEEQAPGPYDERLFAITYPREELYRRIDERIDEMLANGLVKEVRRLMRTSDTGGATSIQAIGYKEIAEALRGGCSLGEAIDRVRIATKHYAKRQETWFRRDKRTCWIAGSGRSAAGIADEILTHLNRNGEGETFGDQ